MVTDTTGLLRPSKNHRRAVFCQGLPVEQIGPLTSQSARGRLPEARQLVCTGDCCSVLKNPNTSAVYHSGPCCSQLNLNQLLTSKRRCRVGK